MYIALIKEYYLRLWILKTELVGALEAIENETPSGETKKLRLYTTHGS